MPDRQQADEIRTAGAVLWRPAGSGAQVAVVHRPKYDDWSLAKGKVDAGEHVLLAAVREVAEETGLRVTLGLRLRPVHYRVSGQPKRVDYWAGRAAGQAGPFVPNNEIDTLDWLALPQARSRLSYEHDVALLAEFGAAPRPTVPLILLRHASAGSKSDWPDGDASRPLDARGRQQAAMLARLLSCFGVGRVLSSPAERCLATVAPFAALTGAVVEPEPAFAVADDSAEAGAGPAAALDLPDAAMRAAASAATDGRPVVICAHRENLPLLLTAACAQLGADQPGGAPLRKGEFLVLHRADGRLAGAERHQPDGD